MIVTRTTDAMKWRASSSYWQYEYCIENFIKGRMTATEYECRNAIFGAMHEFETEQLVKRWFPQNSC